MDTYWSDLFFLFFLFSWQNFLLGFYNVYPTSYIISYHFSVEYVVLSLCPPTICNILEKRINIDCNITHLFQKIKNKK